MNRIGITCDDTNHVRTLHEMKLYRGPVGEQDCIHGMVHGTGRTELQTYVVVSTAVGSVSSVQSQYKGRKKLSKTQYRESNTH